MKKLTTSLWVLLLTLVTAPLTSNAQNVTLPRASQQATVSQRVGISDVTIVYSQPRSQGKKYMGVGKYHMEAYGELEQMRIPQ